MKALDSASPSWLHDFLQDSVYAFRALRRTPTVTLVAILTLALGVSASTATFSVLWNVVLQPLPLPAPAEVVQPSFRTRSGSDEGFSPGTYLAWRDETSAFAHLAALRPTATTLTDGDQAPTRVELLSATHDLFPTLGIIPTTGRFFTATDDSPGAEAVVVLSHRLWSQRFGADPSVVDRYVQLDGASHRVIGVLPAAVTSFGPWDLYRPLALVDSQRDNTGSRYLGAIGRLAPGATTATAEAELSTLIAQREILDFESKTPLLADVAPLLDTLIGEGKSRIWTLFGAVLAVLIIACGNVALLLLARGALRTRELGIRAALGAGRGRLIRQLLTENLVLASAGTLLGVILSIGLVRGLVTLLPAEIPRRAEIAVDGPTLLFACVLVALSTLVFGVAPALTAAQRDPKTALDLAASRGSVGGGTRLHRLFVIGQVALSVILLAAAALLIKSALLLAQVPAGYDRANVVTGQLALPRSEYPELPRVIDTYHRIAESATTVPGIDSAAIVSRAPLAGREVGLGFVLEGGDDAIGSRIRLVSPGSFAVTGVGLRGRDFTTADRADTEPVVIVNTPLARRLEPSGDVVGRTLVSTSAYVFGDENGNLIPLRIVGIADGVRDDGPRAEAEPAVYLPLTQAPEGPWNWMDRQMQLVVRTSAPPSTVVKPLTEAVQRIDPNLPLHDVQTLDRALATTLATERLNTALLSALGLIGLLLTAAGVYGVIATFVSHRRQEIGVRMALGASASAVHRLVVRQGMTPVVVGLAIGLLGAFWATRWLENQLYGVEPTDPVTLSLVIVVLFVAGLVASAVPAGRASRIHPAVALRQD
ncbi:MAG: ABC transporter permease [Acidobacteriota bacterium]